VPIGPFPGRWVPPVARPLTQPSALVGQPADFPSTPILDTFAGTLSSFTSPYFVGDVAMAVASGAASSSSSGTWADAVWTAPFAADQEVYVTARAAPADLWLYARADTPSARNAYLGGWETGTFYLQKYLLGSPTTLLMAAGGFAAGDGLGLRCVGTRIQLWKRSGGAWAKVMEVTDSSLTGGGVIGFQGPQATVFDDFGGGAIGVVAGTPFTASASDSWTFSDTATISPLSFARAGADSFAVSDAATRLLQTARTSSDAFTVSDAASRVQPAARSSSDAVSISDAATRGVVSPARTAGDAFSVSDAATRVSARARTASDSWSISDAAAGTRGQSRTAADSWSISDARCAGCRRSHARPRIRSRSRTRRRARRSLELVLRWTRGRSRTARLARLRACVRPRTRGR
jgi:hypothetical protein